MSPLLESLSAPPRAVERVPSLNMTTGPVEVTPAVLAAQSAVITSPHVDDFWALHDDTLHQLARILGTDGLVLATPGSIRAGLNIALANFVGSGTRVLAVTNGYWGELIADICKSRGGEVVALALPPLTPVDPSAVRRAVEAQGPFDLITIVHVETNVGVVNPIAEIGVIARRTGSLYFVDTACSAGAMPIETDRACIDIGVTGSHKCLGAVPGLTIFTLSDRAMAVLAKAPHETGFFNFSAMKTQTLDRPAPPPYTQPPGLFAALHCALAEIERGGQEAWFARHRQAASAFRTRIRALGMAMLPDLATGSPTLQPDQNYSDTVLAVAYPEGLDDLAFRTCLSEEHGIFVIGNLGDWSGRSFRVGLMSAPQIASDNMERTLGAIEQALATVRSR